MMNLRRLNVWRSVTLQLRGLLSTKAAPKESDVITITDRCVERLRQIVDEGEFLRVMVDGGGCSGFQYNFSMDKKIQEDDKVYEKDGVKIVVDSMSMDFLQGSTIDYEEELIRSAFRVTSNPRALQGCSCGTSFSLK